MKRVLLVAALGLALCACDKGGCVTRQEAAQAFQQRDRALTILAQEVSILQKNNKPVKKEEKKKK